MLSKDALKMLKWIADQNRWMDVSQIKGQYKNYDERNLKAIADKKYLERQINTEGKSWIAYRISDSGKAYIEGARYARQANFREWMSFVLSLSAIAISIIALLMQEGIL